jgi:hypothetical protein
VTKTTLPGGCPTDVQGGDPLRLTANGEFVLKNLVLIGTVLVLLGVTAGAGSGRWSEPTG